MIIDGDSNIGKSWIIMDLALTISSGKKWLGLHPTEKCKVLIIDEENYEVLNRNRLLKMLKHYDVNVDLYFSHSCGIDLSPIHDYNRGLIKSPDVDPLLDAIGNTDADLVIFDSLTRIHHANENDSGEMAQVFKWVKYIVDNAPCSTLFAHHFNKGYGNGSGRIRGSSDIRAFADYVIMVTPYKKGKIETGGVVISHDKSRWGARLDDIHIHLSEDYKIEEVDEEKIIELWMWIANYMKGKQRVKRGELVEAARKAGIAGKSTVDNELKARCEDGLIESVEYGHYRLTTKALDELSRQEENDLLKGMV